MSKNVKAQILLRSDTFSNWFTNRNTTIANKELIVVKYDDGSYGFKIGFGDSYANTGFIKFQTLATNNITNGTYTYSLPSKTGTLALTSDLDSKLVTHQPPFSTSSWIVTGVDNPSNYYVELYDLSGSEGNIEAHLIHNIYGVLKQVYIDSMDVESIDFGSTYDPDTSSECEITALKAYSISLQNRSINTIIPFTKQWVWQDSGISGDISWDSEYGGWRLTNANFNVSEDICYEAMDATQLYFYSYDTVTLYLTLDSIEDYGEGTYYYTFHDSNNNYYYGYGYSECYEIYDDNTGQYYYNYGSSVNPSSEIGTEYSFSYDYSNTYYVDLTSKIYNINIEAPTQIQDKSRQFVVQMDLSELSSSELPIIKFPNITIKNPFTFTNKLYLLKFTEISSNNFIIENLLLESDLAALIDEI